MNAGKSFMVLLVVACAIAVFSEANKPTRHITNSFINEHAFLRVVQNGNEAFAREVLGNPNRSGEGEVVRCEVPGDDGVRTHWTIQEHSDNPKPDYYLYYSNGTESIRLLYSGFAKSLIAAEYMLDGVPLYFTGPANYSCRSIPMITGFAVTTIERNSDFERRKRVLKDFFKEQIDKPRKVAEQVPTTLRNHVGELPDKHVVEPPDEQVAQVIGMDTSVLSQSPTRQRPSVQQEAHDETIPPKTEVKEPDEKDFRLWADSTGKFTVMARCVEAIGDRIKLLKQNGSTVEVSAKTLSREDQEWLETKMAAANAEKQEGQDSAEKKAALDNKRAEHTTWTVDGVWQVRTRIRHTKETIQGELVSFQGSDVALKNVRRWNGIQWALIGKGNMTLKYGRLDADDQAFLKEYRKMEKEYRR